ncbi:hypothetical protein G6F31_015191 [Rhizopus arrhizus]|nr:hypothetical protein G6F31_015191 [Rhizopus arrhizus]
MRAAAGAQRMARHQRDLVAVAVPDQGRVAAAHVVLDVRVVVVAAGLGNAVPRAQHQCPVLAVQADVQHHPGDAGHAPAPATDRIDVADHHHHFGFVVGFAERARILAVVGLPARALGIAGPDVAVVAEQVLGDLGLEADLELQFGTVQHLRRGDRVGRVRRMRRGVAVAGPERGQQVHRLVGPQLERAELGVFGQLPAAVQQRAAAGVGQRTVRCRRAEQVAHAFAQFLLALAHPRGLPLFAARLRGGLCGSIGSRSGLRGVREQAVVAGQAGRIGGDGRAGSGRGVGAGHELLRRQRPTGPSVTTGLAQCGGGP